MADTGRDVWIVKPGREFQTVPPDVGALELRAMGSLVEVRAAISGAFPDSSWLDSWSAVVDGPGWMAELSIAVGEPTREVTLKVHGRASGPEEAFDAIRGLCVTNGWRAIDLDEWEFVA